MKKLFATAALTVLFMMGLQAQVWTNDSVRMNAGLTQNIFYDMATTGPIKTESSTNWHLGFCMNVIGDSASIIANHNVGNAFTKVYNVHRGAADWNMVDIADTLNADELFNGGEYWYQGAFNDIPSANPFNYGWGTYDQTTNNVLGDSIFIVKTQGAFYKFMVDSLNGSSATWNLRIQKLDLIGMTQTYTIAKAPNYNERLFAYFNLDSMMDLDREPVVTDWDLQFITYPQLVAAGPPPAPTAMYGVTGVLSNKNILTTKVQNMDVDDAYNDWGNNFWTPSDKINTIGYDWKVFDQGTFTYQVLDSLSYFVKQTNNDVYQLQFLEFGGSTTGDIKFRKRLLGNVLSVHDVNSSIVDYNVFPNPAATNATFTFTAKENAAAQLNIIDINGRIIKQYNKQATKGLNAWSMNTANIPSGHYILRLAVSGSTIQHKMTILR